MTSANVAEYSIYKDGKEVGHHRQHAMCKTNWRALLEFTPVDDYMIQAWGYDEDEEYWSNDMESLKDFMQKRAKSIEREIHAERVGVLINASKGMTTKQAGLYLEHGGDMVETLKSACSICYERPDIVCTEHTKPTCGLHIMLAKMESE